MSFKVLESELFAFLDVNGVGKSTTISMFCGNLKIDLWRLFVCCRDVSKEGKYIKRQIGVVFQESVLARLLSVYDNL